MHPDRIQPSPESRGVPGPRRVLSLVRRGAPLSDPSHQIRVLEGMDLRGTDGEQASFAGVLRQHGLDSLRPGALEIFQMNLGRMCNMSCRHCHVDAGPDRREIMTRETIDACLEAIDRSGVHTVDLTGGAPEMNPHFMGLVDALVDRGLRVMDRCNLTILLANGFSHLPRFLADRGVEIVCSLPHHRPRNTDAQRGEGTFGQSIEALRRLNAEGYGQGDPRLRLTLVTNPTGAFLAGDQSAQEREWKLALARDHGVTFDTLVALNNMPIGRFLEWLDESSNLQDYCESLLRAFNPATVPALMCRNTLSVSWDGRVFDCDFNQMLDIGIGGGAGDRIEAIDLERAADRRIRTGRHCFGCTAGAGSSCGGALTEPARG